MKLLLTILLSLLSLTSNIVRADSKDLPGYYLSVSGARAFYTVRVNGVTVARDFEARDSNLNIPVGPWLSSGRNEISVTFVSVNGSPFKHNVANPDFYFEAKLGRIDLRTRQRSFLDLLSLKLDAANRVVRAESPERHGERMAGEPSLVSAGEAEPSDLASGWEDSFPARRVTAVFELSEEFPARPFTSGQAIVDTPEFRRNLLDAYRKVHEAIASADRSRVRDVYASAWQHIALAMSYATVDDFIEKASPFDDLAPIDGNGRRLEALDLVKGEGFDVEIMAGGRLARIIPDPIIWSADRFGMTKSSNVAFFLDAEGELHVGTVLP